MTDPSHPYANPDPSREPPAGPAYGTPPPDLGYGAPPPYDAPLDPPGPWPPGPWSPGPPPPPPPHRSRTPLLLAVGGVVLIALVVGVVLALKSGGGGGGSGSDRTLTIDYTVEDPDNGVDCSSGGTGNLADIQPGMPVRVTDENGTVVASTTLPDTGASVGSGAGCTWSMDVSVPDGVTQYGVEVGSRGTVTFSHEKLDSAGWTASVSLG